MSGAIVDQIRSATGKVWYDRFDLGGFARFARARHPSKTATCVAAETGLPVDSVKKWLGGEAVPGGRALLALICCYGPSLVHEMVHGAPGWMSSAAREARQHELEAAIAAQQAELDQLRGATP